MASTILLATLTAMCVVHCVTCNCTQGFKTFENGSSVYTLNAYATHYGAPHSCSNSSIFTFSTAQYLDELQSEFEKYNVWIGCYDDIKDFVTTIHGSRGSCVAMRDGQLSRERCDNGWNFHHICRRVNGSAVELASSLMGLVGCIPHLNDSTSPSESCPDNSRDYIELSSQFRSIYDDGQEVPDGKNMHDLSMQLVGMSAECNDFVEFVFMEDNFDLTLRTVFNTGRNTIVDLQFAYITIPSGALGDGERASIAITSSNNPSFFEQNDKNPANGRIVATPIVSIVLEAWGSESLNLKEYPIQFELFHLLNQTENHKKNCSFWKVLDNETYDGEWSSDGCQVVVEGASSTTCSCTHLTNFAVLMSLNPDELGDTTVLSTVFGILSIICLILTLLIFGLLRMYKNERVVIHGNLSLALLISQLIFLTGIEKTDNKIACTVIAVLLHYFLLASFAWILIEGALLFVKALFVVHRQLHPFKLILIGWSLPIPIVAVTLAAALNDYGDDSRCWLSENAIWAFICPVIFVTLVNLVIVGFVLRSFLRLKANKNKSEYTKIKVTVRALLILQPLMGFTWIIGLASNLSIIFVYIFVCLNSLQGFFIFVLYCLNTDEFKAAFTKYCRKKPMVQVGPKSSKVPMKTISGEGSTQSSTCPDEKDTGPVVKRVQNWVA